MLRGGGEVGLRRQAEQLKSERIAEGWKLAARGTTAQLGAIDDQVLGCTSVVLAPDSHGAIAANIITQAFLPDWSVAIAQTATPKS